MVPSRGCHRREQLSSIRRTHNAWKTVPPVPGNRQPFVPASIGRAPEIRKRQTRVWLLDTYRYYYPNKGWGQTCSALCLGAGLLLRAPRNDASGGAAVAGADGLRVVENSPGSEFGAKFTGLEHE